MLDSKSAAETDEEQSNEAAQMSQENKLFYEADSLTVAVGESGGVSTEGVVNESLEVP